MPAPETFARIDDEARLQLNENGSLRHLLTLNGLAKSLLVELLDAAQSFVSPAGATASRNDRVSILNAGESDASHPTQGLLDLLTIRQKKGDFTDLTASARTERRRDAVCENRTRSGRRTARRGCHHGTPNSA